MGYLGIPFCEVPVQVFPPFKYWVFFFSLICRNSQYSLKIGLPWWLSGKESFVNAGDVGLILGSGRFSGEWNGNPFQYSSLGNPMDRGVWWDTGHRVAKSQTQLSDWAHTHSINVFLAEEYEHPSFSHLPKPAVGSCWSCWKCPDFISLMVK